MEYFYIDKTKINFVCYHFRGTGPAISKHTVKKGQKIIRYLFRGSSTSTQTSYCLKEGIYWANQSILKRQREPNFYGKLEIIGFKPTTSITAADKEISIKNNKVFVKKYQRNKYFT